jgi:hypothetical protein
MDRGVKIRAAFWCIAAIKSVRQRHLRKIAALVNDLGAR